MSDTKKPTVSEIVAREQHAIEEWNRTRAVIPPPPGDIPHLLALVERMGKRLKIASPLIASGCQCQGCQETRALLEEIKL